MQKVQFVCLRYFLVPTEEIFLEVAGADPTPGERFDRLFFQNGDFELTHGVEYAIRVSDRDGSFRIGKLAKLQMKELHETTPDDIAEKDVEDWPYMDFIANVDPQVQAIVIRMSTKVVSKVETLIRHMEKIAKRSGLTEQGFSVSFRPIVSESEFWQVVESAEEIFSLKLFLRSPNLFGARMAANEALRETREQYNNTEVEVKLKNPHGELRIPRDDVEQYREYADAGGGDWEVDLKSDGKRKKVSSTSKAVKIKIEIENLDNPLQFMRRAWDRFVDLL